MQTVYVIIQHRRATNVIGVYVCLEDAEKVAGILGNIPNAGTFEVKPFNLTEKLIPLTS
jgi:hypothetical protein